MRTTVERVTPSSPHARPIVLRVMHSDGSCEMLRLDDDVLTIGRSKENRLVVDDSLTSRFHACVENGVVKDLDSRNGTMVNGRPVSEHVLEEGDLVKVGHTLMLAEPVVGRAPGCLDELEALGDVLTREEAGLDSLDDVVGNLCRLVGACHARIILLEEDTRNPLMQFSGGRKEDADYNDVLRAAIDAEQAAVHAAGGRGLLRHTAFVPLHVRGRRHGVVVLERDPGDQPFDSDDLRVACLAGTLLSVFVRMVM